MKSLLRCLDGDKSFFSLKQTFFFIHSLVEWNGTLEVLLVASHKDNHEDDDDDDDHHDHDHTFAWVKLGVLLILQSTSCHNHSLFRMLHWLAILFSNSPHLPFFPPLNFLSSEPLQIHTYDHDRNDDFCGAVFFFFLFSLGWPLRWSQLAPCNIIRLGHHHILPNSQARSSYSTTTKQAVLLLPLYTSNVMNLHDDIPLAFGV